MIGLAFKGVPETSDIRESVSLKLVQNLPVKTNIRIKDFVVDDEVIVDIGCSPVRDILAGFEGAHVVLIMNNHPLNTRFNMPKAFDLASSPFMIFDGWNTLNQRQVERFDGAYYATHGYLTESNP